VIRAADPPAVLGRLCFKAALAAVAVLAAAIRVVHAVDVAPHTTGLGDGVWFQFVSTNLANGYGFVVPHGSVFSKAFHQTATAEHPPLYPLALAGAIKLGITANAAQRALGALFGTVTVVALGLLGRRAAGPAVGLVAAAIACVHPLLIAADGALLSETLYGAILSLTLLAAWRLQEHPSAGRAAAVGAGIGLAALTRSEAVLLVFLLALPVALRGRRPWLHAGIATLATIVVIAPWVIRNWSVFGHPLLSNNDGLVVADTNCHRAYHGRNLGFLVLACTGRQTGNEAHDSARWLRQGADYASSHAGRVPVVAAVRLLRAWNLYQPFRSAREEGRSANVQKAGIVFYYLLLIPAAAGLVLLRRRRVPLLVLLAPAALASVEAILTYGSMRLRYPGDLTIVILAAAGMVGLARRLPLRQAPRAVSA
jgi:4-amino-4-deoxy-L-arabinose transferase-like glycosyltransferase